MLRSGLLVADVAAAAIAVVVPPLLTHVSVPEAAALTVGVTLAWPALTYAFGLYAADELSAWASGIRQAARLIVAGLVASWPLAGAMLLLGVPGAAWSAVAMSAVLVLASALFRAVARTLAHRAEPLRQRALIVGSGTVAGQLVKRLRAHDELGVEPVGLVDDEVSELDTSGLPRLGRIEDLGEVIPSQDIDRVIISFTRASHSDLLRCIRICRDEGVAVDVVPRLFEFLDGAHPVETMRGLPLLSLDAPRLSGAARVAKRTLDIVVSSVVLVLLMPMLLMIAAAIKLDSRGPVLFRQWRAGVGGKPFRLLKFRTMRTDAEARKPELAHENDIRDGVMFKIWRDPRTTRLGRRLRRLSLDELPQLINVLRGDMSLVGPRPLVFEEAEALAETWHSRRLDLKPGITGLWQVAGRNHVPFQEMLKLDYQYVAGWTLARDIELMLATIPAVLSRRGAY
ncbi:MAG TPA: exopolysaccharide biosynthesis polyprenyl glycosylphosphotransferase [Candidatus Dormibacteraeota bacterium]|nr:exopolysaccharide biosynthesis polyprenyl glycosylphosphotransferase [Candidatus Dormibacteraeota bacterium]